VEFGGVTEPLRLELRIAFAALRRIVTQPSRRALWFATGALAAAAIVFDVMTSDVAARDLGRWTPSPLLIAAVSAGILAVAALVGSRTPLTYGTRAADVTWWRYAGVGTADGQRATTAILTARATLSVAAVAAPVGALLALAAPQRAASIIALAAVAVVLATLTVLVSSACAPRARDDERDVSGLRALAGAAHDEPPVAPRVRRSNVPAGLMAARWLVAVRRGETLVPFDRLAFGLVAGWIVPHFATGLGGELVSLAIVVGGLALLLDAAIRGTIAPATLRSPWWRAAIGTSPVALTVWALSDALGPASVLIGIAIGLGIALGDLVPALAALPAIVLVPVALRLVVLAVDTFHPAAADRRGAGAAVRITVVGFLACSIFTLALVAGAYGGVFAAIATVTLMSIAVVIAAAWLCAARLPSAIG
jgi:hypothetical protein